MGTVIYAPLEKRSTWCPKDGSNPRQPQSPWGWPAKTPPDLWSAEARERFRDRLRLPGNGGGESRGNPQLCDPTAAFRPLPERPGRPWSRSQRTKGGPRPQPPLRRALLPPSPALRSPRGRSPVAGGIPTPHPSSTSGSQQGRAPEVMKGRTANAARKGRGGWGGGTRSAPGGP